MTINYTANLSLGQPVTGTESGTWGDDVNNAITAYLDIAVAGTLSLTGASFTAGALTLANTQGTSTGTNIGGTTAQYAVLKASSLSTNSTITAPSTSKVYLVINNDATYTLTVKASGQTGYTVGVNSRAFVVFDGTDYVLAATPDITKLTGTLPVINGGTGQTSYTDGQLLIGNSVGNTLTKATLTAGSGISITNGNGSISISATGSGGTVTSVSWTGGIVSVANDTTTPAFTVAGTSGGIPYFSSASTWASSAALAANAIVLGGGAGAAPATTATGTGVVTALGNNANTAAGFVTGTGTATLQNKRIDPRVSSAASASSLTPDVSAADMYAYTALAANLTINAPTGTPVDGDKLVLRILDNGTSRTLTWNATYTAIGVTLPTSTTINKMTYVGCIYNAANTRWDVIAVTTQA